MAHHIGSIQTEVAMEIIEVIKMLIEGIIITIEVEVLQTIDFKRGHVINVIIHTEVDPIVINTRVLVDHSIVMIIVIY